MQEAHAKAPVALVVGQAQQVIGDRLVLGGQLRLIPIAGITDPEGRAGQPDRDSPSSHRLHRHLAPARWLHHLFCERILHDIGLEALLGIHLLEPTILFLELLQPAHERGVHLPNLARHLYNVAELMPC